MLEEAGEFPLVLSDIYMPEIGRRAEVTTAVESLQLGAVDDLAKPVRIEEFRARVENAVAGFQRAFADVSKLPIEIS